MTRSMTGKEADAARSAAQARVRAQRETRERERARYREAASQARDTEAEGSVPFPAWLVFVILVFFSFLCVLALMNNVPTTCAGLGFFGYVIVSAAVWHHNEPPRDQLGRRNPTIFLSPKLRDAVALWWPFIIPIRVGLWFGERFFQPSRQRHLEYHTWRRDMRIAALEAECRRQDERLERMSRP